MNRVVDVGLAGFTELPFMCFGTKQIGAVDQRYIIGGKISFELSQQVADQ
jgi:hypothetical protein